jgi:carbon monoxide dehydrogenase subunit G
MAIPFSGEFSTPVAAEQAYDFLSDPTKFGPLLPDFQSMTQHDATHFTVKLNVGVAHLRGTTDINMELREAERPRHLLYLGQGNAFGNAITVKIGFDLYPWPASTLVAWRGEADVVGKLAMMAGTMMEPLAGKGMSKLMDGLKNTLAQQAAPPTSPEKDEDSPVAGANVVLQQDSMRDAAEPPTQPPSDAAANTLVDELDPSTGESNGNTRQS